MNASTYKNNSLGFRSLTWVFLLGISLFANACIEELDTTIITQENLVINGQLSNSEGLREVTVVNVKNPDGSGERLDATGSIYKNGQLSAELSKRSNGILVLPPDYVIEAGAEYFVEIKLPGGEVYSSAPQFVSPALRTDSASLEVLEENPFEPEEGEPIVSRGIAFFTHIKVPPLEEERQFYRWVVGESWSFVESNGRDTCYVREGIQENPFTLYSNSGLNTSTGDVKVLILQHPLDKSFAHQHYINAFLHTLDQVTFDYYQKVERISGSTGTFYDEVPGPIEGNVFNVDDPEDQVRGWVEFFLADTFRFRVRRRDIPTNSVPKQCDDVLGGGPCPPSSQVPCQCLACDAILGPQTAIPPDYWID